jgi:branched-chain amino acid transport system substrate-binding protein
MTQARICLTSILISIAVVFGATAQTPQPYDVHVIVSLTGGAAFLGQAHRDTFETLAAMVNGSGGIKGRPVHFIYHDDQTNPQVAVQLTNEVLALHPVAILGPSLVGMCAAMAPLLKNGPVDYCLSPALLNTEKFTFSAGSSPNDDTWANLRYYRAKGWTKIATISSTDASGQGFDRSLPPILALPENKDVSVVDRETFNPSDLSVAAQIAHLKTSGAQAILIGATGAAVATVLRGLYDAGIDKPAAVIAGNEIFALMHQWKDFLPKNLVLESSAFPEHQGRWKLDPRVEAAQHAMYSELAKHGLKADNGVATSWDAGLIVLDALKSLGPDATPDQVRSYILNLTDFPGVDGVYNFKAHPDRGLGVESAIIVRYDVKSNAWIWLTQPGGAPLK